MAFLDDIDKKLTNLGQGAIQKTREMTDSAKLSGALKNLEGQKKDVLADLGAISYRKLKESGEEARARRNPGSLPGWMSWRHRSQICGTDPAGKRRDLLPQLPCADRAGFHVLQRVRSQD